MSISSSKLQQSPGPGNLRDENPLSLSDPLQMVLPLDRSTGSKDMFTPDASFPTEKPPIPADHGMKPTGKETAAEVNDDNNGEEDGDGDDNEGDEEDGDINYCSVPKDYEPPSWNFPLFIRWRSQWRLNYPAVKWVIGKFHEYDALKPPEGASERVGEERFNKKSLAWRKELEKRLLLKCPFDWKVIAGPDAGDEDEKAAKGRLAVKILNLVKARDAPSRPEDIFDMLFSQERRPSAKDLWYQGDNKNAVTLERKFMVQEGWNTSLPPTKSLPILSKARRLAFESLSEYIQKKWRKASLDWTAPEPSKQEIFELLPKFVFDFFDAITKKTGLSIYFWAGGSDPTGKIISLREEWYDVKDADSLKFLGSKEYRAVDYAFKGYLANKHSVSSEDIVIIPPFRPKIPNLVPKDAPTLCHALDFNEGDGRVTSGPSIVRGALSKYFQSTWASVPLPNGKPRKGKNIQPPWDLIDQAKGEWSTWIDSQRLPDIPGFRFGRPSGLAEDDLFALASWIMKGELGLLNPSQTFQWVGQLTSSPVVKKPSVEIASVTTEIANPPGKSTLPGKVSAAAPEGVSIVPIEILARPNSMSDVTTKVNPAPSKSKRRAKKTDIVAGSSVASKVVAKSKKDVKESAELELAQRSKLGETATAPVEPAIVKSAPTTSITKSTIVKSATRKYSKACQSEGEEFDLDAVSGSDGNDELGRINSDTVKYLPMSKEIIAFSAELVSKGTQGQQFGGDRTSWRSDFISRESQLEWDNEMDGAMGSSAVNAARFIEANELQHDAHFNCFLDVTEPLLTDNKVIAELFDQLCDASAPVPHPRLITRIPTWSRISIPLFNRVHAGLYAILSHRTNSRGYQMRLSGSEGVWALLRLVEFLRRCMRSVELKTKLGSSWATESAAIEELVRRTEMGLSLEMWRRWAVASFASSPSSVGGNLSVFWSLLMEARLSSSREVEWFQRRYRLSTTCPLVESLYNQAGQRQRGCQIIDMTVHDDDEMWVDPQAITTVHEWSKFMNMAVFISGSVVDQFAWVYSLHMIAGYAILARSPWLYEAVTNTETWIKNIIVGASPNIWRKQSRLIKVNHLFKQMHAPEVTTFVDQVSALSGTAAPLVTRNTSTTQSTSLISNGSIPPIAVTSSAQGASISTDGTIFSSIASLPSPRKISDTGGEESFCYTKGEEANITPYSRADVTVIYIHDL